jgi:hypothetical protein
LKNKKKSPSQIGETRAVMISLFIGTVGQADDDFIISQSAMIATPRGHPCPSNTFLRAIRKREINFLHISQTTQFLIKEYFLIRPTLFSSFFAITPMPKCGEFNAW